MTKLSVNINKVATLRNARGGSEPDVVKFAQRCEELKCDGITVHPRPDERHIRYADVHKLRPLLKTEFNIEGYPTESFIDLVLKVRPAQVTLVPDAPDAITSNAGWDTKANCQMLAAIVDQFQQGGIRVSIFVDPNVEMVEYAAKAGADRVELYTEPYAAGYTKDREQAVAPYVEAAQVARKLGLGLNAGHDLNLENLAYFCEQVKYVEEVSIGHALIADALYMGIEETIKAYKAACNPQS